MTYCSQETQLNKGHLTRDYSEKLVRKLRHSTALPYNPRMSKNKLFPVISFTALEAFQKDLSKVVYLC